MFLRPRPELPGRGPLFYLHPGRSPESQAKERQQRQDKKAFHGGQLLYPCGSMRRVSAWNDRVTEGLYLAGSGKARQNPRHDEQGRLEENGSSSLSGVRGHVQAETPYGLL